MTPPEDAASGATTDMRDFIASTIWQIKEALPEDARISGPIGFEMSAVVQNGKSGGIELRIINFGAGITENQTQKISFSIQHLSDVELEEEAVRKIKAETDRIKAETDKEIAEEDREVVRKSIERK